MTHRQRVKKHT